MLLNPSLKPNLDLGKSAGSVRIKSFMRTTSGLINRRIKDIMPMPDEGESIVFGTEGRWSSHDLLNFYIQHTGKVKVYKSSFALSEDAARIYVNLIDAGLIEELHYIVDTRSHIRHANAMQLVQNRFTRVVRTPCHAKVTVMQNDIYNISIIGSMNDTSNPRIEVGVVINDKVTADFNRNWIINKIEGRKPFGK